MEKHFSKFILLCGMLGLACLMGYAATVTLTQDGIVVKSGPTIECTLTYPSMTGQDDKKYKPIEKSINNNVITLKYEQGTEIRITLTDAKTIEYAMSGVKTIKSFSMGTVILPVALCRGGKWWAGNREGIDFPVQLAEPFLFAGNSGVFQFVDVQGHGLRFTMPSTFQQLQDNRKWGGWQTFAWLMIASHNPAMPNDTVTINVDDVTVGDGKPVVVCDRFGQSVQDTFPGKVTREEELRADVAQDAAYYASLTPPKFDHYGGEPGSRQKYGLRATGFFHVEKKANRWLMVDPDGNAFFHLGVCGVGSCDDYTSTKGRENIYEWLPAQNSEYATAFLTGSTGVFSYYRANVIRKYEKPFNNEEWGARFADRLRKWGFNSVGAFINPTQSILDKNFPYVLFLPFGTETQPLRLPGVGFFDPFNAQTPGVIDRAFVQLASKADDPRLIGYFLGNEQPFEGIPHGVAALKGNFAAKQHLVSMLRDKYQTIDRFNVAWGMQATSFEQLADMGLPISTQAASSDMMEYTAQFIEAYYKVIADTFHKYDTHHMLIGNRWQVPTANNQQLCHIAGHYMDIVSINYYTYGIDKELTDRLYHWAGDKPLMFSEFYFSCQAESGLGGGGGALATQRERGLAYRNYVERAASLGYVVGIEWFASIDQALTGRFFQVNGENANIGLVNVADRPYKDFLAECMKTNYNIYPIVFGEMAPFVFSDPRFSGTAGTAKKIVTVFRALPGMKVDGSIADWPPFPANQISGNQVVLGKNDVGLNATFRLCYDDTNLYVYTEVHDKTPLQNTLTGADIWNSDAVELFIGSGNPDQGGPLQFGDRQIILRAAKPDPKYHWWYHSAQQQSALQMAITPMIDGSGYTLEAAIPFSSLGFSPKSGQHVLFDMGIDDGDNGQRRMRQLMWNGVALNSGDRSHWGTAILQ
ncbi:MAG TPA: sugar-binding protein [Armatimonadota bacterium]|nr:sugar-binding protein [Armatimonadota bacterium]